jgi:hypothetical protein
LLLRFMAEGTAQRFVRAVFLFHECEGLASAEPVAECNILLRVRICRSNPETLSSQVLKQPVTYSRPKFAFAPKTNPQRVLTFWNGSFGPDFLVPNKLKPVVPLCGTQDTNASNDQRCLKIISSIIPYSLACSGFMM